MHGLMMDTPLLLSRFLDHAVECHGDVEIVSRDIGGGLHRYTYADASRRIRRLAAVLVEAGIRPGDRIASLAWNTHRHFELFYAVTGIGAVLNTVNPRLHDDHIAYILNHGGARALFADAETVEIADRLAPKPTSIEKFFLLAGSGVSLEPGSIELTNVDEAIAAQGDGFAWPVFDERTASILCFTSGTSGKPKGVLFSHRANVLQTMHAASAYNILGGGNGATPALMPIAALFHGNGWNMPFIAPYLGAKLVLCGRDFRPESLLGLILDEQVTLAAAVPTVWMALIDAAREDERGFGDLRQALSSGSTPPAPLFDELLAMGVELTQTYGMTESMYATTCTMRPGASSLAPEEVRRERRKSGRGCYGVELRLVDDSGVALPWDGKSPGHLRLRGPWTSCRYYESDEPALDAEGWLITGDIATVDHRGCVVIRDRAKDVIKSGGEWISSIELEQAALQHQDVRAVAVIAMAHPRWQERPFMIVVREPNSPLDADSLRMWLKGRVANWCLPDEIEFAEELPLAGTGKVDKRMLRERYGNSQPLGNS